MPSLQVDIYHRPSKVDPRIFEAYAPGSISPASKYLMELRNLHYDKIGQKWNEVIRRQRRLASMEEVLSQIMPLENLLSQIRSFLGSFNNGFPEPVIAASVEQTVRHPALPTESADLDWCNQVTSYYMNKCERILASKGFSSEVTPLDDETEEVAFLKDGTGWAFIQLAGGDFVFDMYSVTPEGEQRLPVFAQHIGREEFEDQGVPLSMMSEDASEIQINPIEAKTYVKNWRTAVTTIMQQAETASNQIGGFEFFRVMNRTLKELSSSSQNVDLTSVRNKLEHSGISPDGFIDYMKLIVPSNKLKSMLDKYNLPTDLLG